VIARGRRDERTGGLIMDVFKPLKKAVVALAIFIYTLLEVFGVPRIPDEKKAGKSREAR
jgi:hypothetical protein